MNRSPWMEDFQKNIADLIAKSPAADLERNVRSMMAQAFTKMDLVTREEFDIQADMLARLRARVDQLAAQVTALQGQGGQASGGVAPAPSSGAAGAASAGHTDPHADHTPVPAASFDPGAAAAVGGATAAPATPASPAQTASIGTQQAGGTGSIASQAGGSPTAPSSAAAPATRK